MKSFEISIPTDQGFFGRICPSESCGKYFKVKADLVRNLLYCPYCGVDVEKTSLLTTSGRFWLTRSIP